VVIGGREMDASRLEAIAWRRILHGQRGGAMEHERQEARPLRLPMLDDRDGGAKIGG
jgi:hypothetical protein